MLAADLGVSRGIVVEAYAQLVAEGYLVAQPRSALRVADVAPPATTPARTRAAPEPRFDLRAGAPDLTLFPSRAWVRSLTEALADLPRRRLGYGDPQGDPELREALAEYLGRVRGVVADPARIVIVGGFAQGFGLACAVLAAEGVTRIAIEDPSHPRLRAAVAAAGLDVATVPVDDGGALTSALPEAIPCVLTPAHQFPTGVVLSPERRAAALRHGGTIVESDYDAEFRYDREPVGALQGLAPEQVLYAGTASKTLAPGLRLGWLVAPTQLVEPLAEAKHVADRGSSLPDQLALARLLRSGRYERHLRRCRRVYRRRRDVVAAALVGLNVRGVAAGLQLVAELPDGVDDREVCRAAARRGVAVDALSSYRIAEPGPPGLVVGYAGVGDVDIGAATTALVEAISEATR